MVISMKEACGHVGQEVEKIAPVIKGTVTTVVVNK